jgi:hypothetical protein
MPIYYGCTSIDNFFPIHTFNAIDDKHAALFFLKEIVNSINGENLRSDIARKLILDGYQLFPFLYNQISVK